MTDIKFFNESKVSLGVSADEALSSVGAIEATVTTWGAREGADGRKFNYKPEGFAQWADEFAKAGKPLPMFFQHNDENFPVGEWTQFEFTDKGMDAKGRLFTNTTAGKDLHTIMKESPNLVGGVSTSTRKLTTERTVERKRNQIKPSASIKQQNPRMARGLQRGKRI